MRHSSIRFWPWVLGNSLMLIGLYLLLYVGGVYADEAAAREAARGDSTLSLPLDVAVETVAPGSPAAFEAPNLNLGTGAQPRPATTADSTISRIRIPAIDVDYKVVPVGWVLDGDAAVWQVAKYAVGHHKGSANPGGANNIVMAGHVGGAAPVFARLSELSAGDQVVLDSAGQEYLYTVTEAVRVQEVGASDDERMENASYMEPGGSEVVTLITCWPPSGPNAFDQRIIIRAVPYSASLPTGTSAWELR